ncbi:head GIN domain-containing protein [Mucilaginibacter lacusdianchii]|uniref:head GIN domain-containing protein n=1 Tax=Mucilaginibacter lacusdianchii TaxID=2684211 RepID=UPI00131C040D|nr:head GIN domain-containing protein [Mucilaginibacter sp. JXJ CY 39]
MKKTLILLLTVLSLTGIHAYAQKTIEQTRDVNNFNAVASSGPFNVHIKIDGSESLKLNIDEELADEVETKVEDGTLKISFKKNHKWSRKIDKAEVYITAKSLKALVNSGSGNIQVDGTIDTQEFNAVLSGSGNITTSVKSNELHAVISGSGSINMSGKANDVNVVINGSGQLRGRELGTRNTTAVISGSGSAYVQASDAINARIVGSGNVVYSGNAKVESKTIGSGSVTKAN